MTLKISLSLVLLSVLKVAVSQYGCNVNEYPTQTVNPCNTCDNRGWCPQNYGYACDCFPGYFRNSQGACVPPEACDGPYGGGTPYGGRDGPECPMINCLPECPIDGNAKPCPRCVCPNEPGGGYNTRESHNCGPNEEFQQCGSACPPSCDNPRPGPCTLQCVSGCFCTAGYVRKDGKCVSQSECEDPAVGPRSYHGGQPTYRPPVRPPRPVTRPVRPSPTPGPYRPPVRPSPTPEPYRPPVRPSPTPEPYRPPVRPTVRPPVYPPTDIKGCPNRNRCNRNCKSEGFAVGFCVGDRFLKCNCMG